MAQLDVLTTDARGRVRPGQPWQRHDARRLALARLASAIEDEAGRYTLDTVVRNLLDDAAGMVRRAAAVLPTPTP